MYRKIFSVIAACLIMSCGSMVVTSLDANLFEKSLHDTPDAQLIDVRTAKECAEGYIPGAIMIDIKGADFDTQIQRLDSSRPVFVYCRSGKRSLEAAKALEKNRFKRVYNLEGGIISWKKLGKEIATDGKIGTL